MVQYQALIVWLCEYLFMAMRYMRVLMLSREVFPDLVGARDVVIDLQCVAGFRSTAAAFDKNDGIGLFVKCPVAGADG